MVETDDARGSILILFLLEPVNAKVNDVTICINGNANNVLVLSILTPYKLPGNKHILGW